MKTVLITGAGRGIGAATAKLLAAQGYAVCVNYKSNSDSAQQVVQHITAEGGRAFAFQADVSNESEVQALFAAIHEQYGTVTHLVNNAGVVMPQSPLAQISSERFSQVLQSNVLSCFLCSKYFVQQATQAGAIVNVSSIAAKTGSPFEYTDYAASKGAMDTLTKGLSVELAAQNIRVNAVRPGFIATQMHADGGEPDRVARIAPSLPLKRGGEPIEVAQAIAWLLSDDASYVTGSYIDLAGGR